MNSFRSRRFLALVLLALLGSGAPARAATEDVDEVGTSFDPAQVSITVNDRVVWTNKSPDQHTVTFERGGPDLHPSCDPLLRIGCQAPGTSVERTFTASGTYPYYCKLHRGMRGVVVVSSATTTTTMAPTSSTLPRATTTSSTARASTSSTTATTRPLATSSTVGTSSTTSTTMDPSSVLLPGDPPAFGEDTNSSAAGQSGGSDGGSDTGTVALIVALLLGVSAAGGFILWRLRPGRT